VRGLRTDVWADPYLSFVFFFFFSDFFFFFFCEGLTSGGGATKQTQTPRPNPRWEQPREVRAREGQGALRHKQKVSGLLLGTRGPPGDNT